MIPFYHLAAQCSFCLKWANAAETQDISVWVGQKSRRWNQSNDYTTIFMPFHTCAHELDYLHM